VLIAEGVVFNAVRGPSRLSELWIPQKPAWAAPPHPPIPLHGWCSGGFFQEQAFSKLCGSCAARWGLGPWRGAERVMLTEVLR